MATATEVIANETEIKQAMRILGLDNQVDSLLNEIELNRRLQISLEQAEKGMKRPAKEVILELLEDLKNGRL